MRVKTKEETCTIYEAMITGLKNGRNAKLPHWNNKFIFMATDGKLGNGSVLKPFIAIFDNGIYGIAILHNCDMFNSEWSFC